MGRVRTKTVKRVSKNVVEKYFPRLTLDFDVNKRLLAEIAIIPSKRLRNKIAAPSARSSPGAPLAFITHLMKRIQAGPVRGISIKLQEEERERRDQYVPDVSALQPLDSGIEVDAETLALLKEIGFGSIKTFVAGASAPAASSNKKKTQRKE